MLQATTSGRQRHLNANFIFALYIHSSISVLVTGQAVESTFFT